MKKRRGIRRKLTLRIVKHLLKKNSHEGYEERLVVAILQSVLGRSGEVLTTCWKYVSLDEDDEVLVMDWPERKAGSQGAGLSFGPDTNWELDNTCFSIVFGNKSRKNFSC